MYGRRRWKPGFVPNRFDPQFAVAVGLEAVGNELRGDYFNIRKGATNIDITGYTPPASSHSNNNKNNNNRSSNHKNNKYSTIDSRRKLSNSVKVRSTNQINRKPSRPQSSISNVSRTLKSGGSSATAIEIDCSRGKQTSKQSLKSPPLKSPQKKTGMLTPPMKTKSQQFFEFEFFRAISAIFAFLSIQENLDENDGAFIGFV